MQEPYLSLIQGMGFYPVRMDTTMQIHPHAAAPWGNRCSSPRFYSILPALAPLYQPRVVSDFWPWAQGKTDENLFWMGTWAWSPNHTLPRWPNARCQALSLSAEMKPLPVTQPHTNKASATGLLSFNNCEGQKVDFDPKKSALPWWFNTLWDTWSG